MSSLGSHLGQKMNILKSSLFGLFLASAITANATSRSSFLDVDSTSGITFIATNGGLTVDVILGTDPTFTIGANTYHVTGVIGFYALSDDSDLTVTNSNFGVWSTDNSNAGQGGVAGWKTNPNSGFGVGNHQVFTYTALSTSLVDSLGLHVITQEFFPGTNANTGNISIVPEPASLAAIGIGVAALIRRKRKQK